MLPSCCFMLFLFCIQAHASSRIVNGTDAKDGEFPFAVSLRHRGRHICGGTILKEKFILTAAHCVCDGNRPRDSTNYSIQYGVNEITTDSTNTKNVKGIFCHEFDVEKVINDCALVELETPLPQDDSWRPVKISQNFKTDKPQTGTIIGWGKTGQEQPISLTLQKLEVQIYDDKTCAKSTDNKHHICFGAPNGGACNGDSGTALLVDGKQVGIASFITSQCGIATKEHPNVYSRIPTYYNWINGIVN